VVLIYGLLADHIWVVITIAENARQSVRSVKILGHLTVVVRVFIATPENISHVVLIRSSRSLLSLTKDLLLLGRVLILLTMTSDLGGKIV